MVLFQFLVLSQFKLPPLNFPNFADTAYNSNRYSAFYFTDVAEYISLKYIILVLVYETTFLSDVFYIMYIFIYNLENM